MRASEDRYHRDRLRMRVALRFLKLRARTNTIIAWTGLSEDRIRKMYRTYLKDDGPNPKWRPRGKSPRRVSYFWQNARVQQEANWIASLFALLGVIPLGQTSERRYVLPNLTRGTLMCKAFDMYRKLIPSAAIPFEYAVFLVNTLTVGEQLKVGACTECGCLVILDPTLTHSKCCHYCSMPRSWNAAPDSRTRLARG